MASRSGSRVNQVVMTSACALDALRFSKVAHVRRNGPGSLPAELAVPPVGPAEHLDEEVGLTTIADTPEDI